MVLVFGLALAITAQPTNNAAEEKGKYIADCHCCLVQFIFPKAPFMSFYPDFISILS